MKQYNSFQIEILIKNIVVVFLSFSLYGVIEEAFTPIPKDILETLILFVGLIIVVPLFSNFAFTYDYLQGTSSSQRYVGHLITFTIMLSTLLLIAMIDILFALMVGDIWVFRFVLCLFLIALILYDFWDAARNSDFSFKKRTRT